MTVHLPLNSVGLDDIVLSDDVCGLATILAKNKKLPSVIYGETGTGKEEFAKIVHKRRCVLESNIPFISVNCANINNDLAASILFGHVRGAFSGADKSTEGLVAAAHGGILFLDEIQALSYEVQQRMLRVLNDGSYNRLGDVKTCYSDFQVIAATTKDLDEEVEKGNFIIDLRSRLLGVEVKLPPLRERKEDIPKFIDIFTRQNKVELLDQEKQQLVDICESYYWQGNIRQLFQVLSAWVALCDGHLSVDRFPSYKSMFAPRSKNSCDYDHYVEVLDAVTQAIGLYIPLNTAIETIESFILRNAIQDAGNLTEVYEGMKLSRNNFYIKRRKYGLTPEVMTE